MPKAAPFRFYSKDEVIRAAIGFVEEQIRSYNTLLDNPERVTSFLKLRIANLEHEVFGAVFLNNRHELIECEELFRGTINKATVYAREVVKRSFQLNAAAVIFYHNHPSGNPEPSDNDIKLTNELKKSLDLIDVYVVDHIIIAGHESTSFVNKGLL